MQLSLKINPTFSLFYCCNKLALAMTVRSIVHTSPPDHVNQREQSALSFNKQQATWCCTPLHLLPTFLFRSRCLRIATAFLIRWYKSSGRSGARPFAFKMRRIWFPVTKRTCEIHMTSRGGPAKHTWRHEANLRNAHDVTRRTCETHTSRSEPAKRTNASYRGQQ